MTADPIITVVSNAAIPESVACLVRGGRPVWLGPISALPEDEFNREGTDCHVHPLTYTRIAERAAATGKGRPAAETVQ